MGLAEPLSLGPLRTTQGLADVHFDGTVLRLVVYRRPLEVLDRYRWVVLALAVVAALGAWYAGWWLLVVAGVLAVLALAAPRRPGEALDVAEADIDTMDPVHGAVRAHLVLHPASGDLTLSGWFWRRRQLDHLQRVLADDGP